MEPDEIEESRRGMRDNDGGFECNQSFSLSDQNYGPWLVEAGNFHLYGSKLWVSESLTVSSI
jgi:hypothetical protein